MKVELAIKHTKSERDDALASAFAAAINKPKRIPYYGRPPLRTKQERRNDILADMPTIDGEGTGMQNKENIR
jgi:hypothetical protein